MPRSRSRSMASSTCASISRAWSAPVISRKRSASVDFPWSMCAMTEKLRMRPGSKGLLARLERTVPLRVLRPDVFRARPDQTIVGVLLEHMRRPAGDAADGEERREQVDRYPERVVRCRRVEIDV